MAPSLAPIILLSGPIQGHFLLSLMSYQALALCLWLGLCTEEKIAEMISFVSL